MVLNHLWFKINPLEKPTIVIIVILCFSFSGNTHLYSLPFSKARLYVACHATLPLVSKAKVYVFRNFGVSGW